MSQENLETPILTWGEHTVTLQLLLSEMKYRTSWHLIRAALNRLVIRTLCDEHNIEASDDEVVEEMDRFRETNDLYSEEEISQWLAQQNLSDDEFYQFCEERAKLALLKEKLFPESEIEKAFAFKKLDLDSVELYHIIASSIDLAEEILESAKEGADFFSLAKRFSAEEETRKACGYLGPITRGDLRPEIAAAAFSAKPGAIIGPFKGTRGYHLYLVDEFHPAELDATTRQQIVDELLWKVIQTTLKQHDVEYAIPASLVDFESDDDADEEGQSEASDTNDETESNADTTRQSVVTEQ